jgi:hypothetical protein
LFLANQSERLEIGEPALDLPLGNAEIARQSGHTRPADAIPPGTPHEKAVEPLVPVSEPPPRLHDRETAKDVYGSRWMEVYARARVEGVGRSDIGRQFAHCDLSLPASAG